MVTLSDIQQRRADILRIAAKYGADNVRVFGSVVRGAAGPGSDLDILVRFSKSTSLIDHIALMQDLEDMLGVKVDVVGEKGLHPLIRDSVLSEVVAL
ncbi:MAG: nucleotidyltransferase family protein [Phycisphaerae bacterium]|nr:nucleotidyltransferase family protein [Phycisphaerae bacterium]